MLDRHRGDMGRDLGADQLAPPLTDRDDGVSRRRAEAGQDLVQDLRHRPRLGTHVVTIGQAAPRARVDLGRPGIGRCLMPPRPCRREP